MGSVQSIEIIKNEGKKMTILYFNHIQMIQITIGTFISMIPLAIFVCFDKKDDGAWLGFIFRGIIKKLKKKEDGIRTA